MATELAALRLIRERTSVPVPEVHFADQAHDLCDADYFFMAFIDADNLGTSATRCRRLPGTRITRRSGRRIVS